MEVVTGNEPTIRIQPGKSQEIGRAHGLDSSDQTISRRHLSLSVAGGINGEEIRLQFEVLGRNPIYVYKDNEVKIFRMYERGEMENGDMFCVSAKNPVWYTVRRIEDGGGADDVRRNDSESELSGNLESDFRFKGVEDLDQLVVDISGVDPVKEFGFVVEGHEFDTYPKKMIRDIKNWDWFLDEEGKNSEDEGKKVKARGRRKRKKGAENDDDDEEWTGESEDVRDKSRKAQRAKYTTRSKDRGKRSEKSSTRTNDRDDEDEDEEDGDEDEDDETLGGFIVDDENLEEEGEGELEEDDEEEELEDEFDEDE